MSNFRFDYNDIHKQVAIADLTDEQIQELFSDFMYLYHSVSSKFLDYYLALFYWVEKNKSRPYIEQAYDIITLLANQTKKIPLAKFKYKPISFDMKRLAI